MVRVQTGNRLHFGLLRLPPTPDWTDDGTRYYGGAGLMIADPGIEISVRASSEWNASGVCSQRALSAAQRYCRCIHSVDRFDITVHRSPSEHVGLGVGTQLELSVASAIAAILDRPDDVEDLARRMKRGIRSGIGVHGFELGGFLFDEGKTSPSELACVRRLEFPQDWLILLITPVGLCSWHAEREAAAFDTIGEKSSERMSSLLAAVIEPTLISGELAAFAGGLTEYNALAGEYYRSIQGGRFAAATVEEILAELISWGAAGGGQSSWGPTVFTFWNDADKLARARLHAVNRWGTNIESCATTARNQGAIVTGT